MSVPGFIESLYVATRNFEIRNPYVFWKMFPFAKLVLSAKHLFDHSHHGYQFFVFEFISFGVDQFYISEQRDIVCTKKKQMKYLMHFVQWTCQYYIELMVGRVRSLCSRDCIIRIFYGQRSFIY